MKKVNLIISNIKNLHKKDLPNVFLTSSFSEFKKKGYEYLDNKDEFKISDPNSENFDNFELIYNELLDLTSKILNKNLKLNKTKRGWEIILGAWLYQNVHTLFFYYNKIKYLNFNKYKYSSTVDNSKKRDLFIYYQKNFRKNPFKDNIFLYKFLSIFLENINEIEKNYNNIDFVESKHLNQTNKYSGLKVFILKLINKLNFFIFKNSQNLIFINKEFVGLKFIFKIFFKSNLKKIILNWNTFAYDDFNYDYKLRSIISNNNYNSNNEFINFVNKFIFFLIPYEYIENYKNNEKLSYKILGKQKYKKIITSVEIFKIPFFSIWLSNQIINKAKLFIYQHGGTYGTTQFNFFEKIEIKISDFYLSWGWKNNDKIIKFFCFKNFKNTKKQNTNKITLVCQNFSLHYTQPHTNFIYGYKTFSEKERLKNLFLKLEKIENYNFKIRHEKITKDDILYEFNKNFRINNNLKLANNNHSIVKCFKKSLLTIHTYEGTSFLESLMFNSPTILFFDINITPIRGEAKYYFDKLNECEIYHLTSESLFQFLIKNNTPKKIYTWWYSNKTQKAASLFRNEFCNVSKNINSNFSLILKNNIDL